MNKQLKDNSCEICTKLFKRPDHLRSHMQTHISEDELFTFICSKMDCGAEYRRKHALKRHLKMAHENITYDC